MRTFSYRSAILLILLLIASGTATAQSPAVNRTSQPNGAELVANITTAATQPEAPPAPWLNPLISASAALLGAFIGGYFASRNAKAAIIQKTNELEIEEIEKRIGDFIAPYEQLSLENLKLSRELKRRHGGNGFRTLSALLDPNWKTALSPGDRALVDAIVENGVALRRLILEHGGAVSTSIRPHLAAASMHFRMLALANAGSLDPDSKRYEAYVYPRQLDDVLARERKRLEARRELLRSKPDIAHAEIEELTIPQELTLPDA
ncbi:hypothetical protein [Azospirillum isscasi]|uniref:DUF4142 domain-containing protein n=1 Tax=Azospirillum isscasi TaxID=3053926 RepID=A0ABU0WEE8_9PROT|nr:hypothetical protein [Azospirillum isscasi]MDQ2102535.1 hypothetical protein [Azospirillum isscasi]